MSFIKSANSFLLWIVGPRVTLLSKLYFYRLAMIFNLKHPFPPPRYILFTKCNRLIMPIIIVIIIIIIIAVVMEPRNKWDSCAWKPWDLKFPDFLKIMGKCLWEVFLSTLAYFNAPFSFDNIYNMIVYQMSNYISIVHIFIQEDDYMWYYFNFLSPKNLKLPYIHS